jgi:hypothetical protein
LEAPVEWDEGNAAFRDQVKLWRERRAADHSIQPRTKTYHKKRLTALHQSWPGRSAMEAWKVSAHDCQQWSGNYVKQASPSNFNNPVGLLRCGAEHREGGPGGGSQHLLHRGQVVRA